MSNYAQEWVWRYSKARGTVKYVFLAIARRIFRNGGIETPPTSVQNLMTMTGLSNATVRRCIEELERTQEIDVVKGTRRGSVHRFRLSQALRLPLLEADPDALSHRSGRAVSPLTVSGDGRRAPPLILSGDSAQNEQCHRSKRAVSPLTTSGEGGAVPSLDLSTSTDLSTTTTATYEAAAAAFLEWVAATYPEHNAGAQITIRDREWQLVAALLVGPPSRNVDRLQEMAVTLWTITVQEDSFLAGTDRSLQILHHAADRLERYAIARATRAPASRPGPVADAPLVRIVERLETLTTGALADVSPRVIEALHAPAPNLAELDAVLYQAACAVVDVGACEADARAQLADYASRMSTSTYASALAAARERLIRQHAHLPDLFVLERRARAEVRA